MKYSILFLIFLLITVLTANSQTVNILDDFSKKAMPGWQWEGITMKYSHEEDNKTNGFAEIHFQNTGKPNSSLGKITKYKEFLFTAGNYINVMLLGVNNDVSARIELLYDIDNNGKYNEDKDIMLKSTPIPLNFSGWKEIKVQLTENNFKIVSKFNDDFSVTEEEVLAFQIEFEAGANFKPAKFESGIALISEIVSKDNLTLNTEDKEKESYFEAKNYPNPFNPKTTISYILKESGHIKLTVYDRLGREVKVLVDETQGPGTHTVEFDGSNYPSGIYFYRIKMNDKIEVKKMILAK